MVVGKIFERFIQLVATLKRARTSPYFGFVKGADYLSQEELLRIQALVGKDDPEVTSEFENAFARLVGSGESVAYASARMAFFDLMLSLGVGKDDEVILPGATCSVMVNAVLRVGATPIFADIDPDTFGSSHVEIEKKITHRTRMIVAQHSFGIPCSIERIVLLAKSRKIFLLEDCALTLGSTVNGKKVGTFGDASLFSTDHSKPLSTLTGGLVYTSDRSLVKRLRKTRANYPNLSASRQDALFEKLVFEINHCVPERYGKVELKNLIASVMRKILPTEGDFLIDDFGTSFDTRYPYPAKLPAFLATLGLIEVERWPLVSEERKVLFSRIMSVVVNSRFGDNLPAAYSNSTLVIVPLRFTWSHPHGAYVREVIQGFTSSHLTWFLRPIVATKEPLKNFKYQLGSCPVSEAIGPKMINIPCNIPANQAEVLISLLKKSFECAQN